MYANHGPLAAATDATLEASLALARAAITSTGSLASLNLNVGKAVLEGIVSNMMVLARAKDFPDFIVLQAAMLRPAVEKSITYSRSGYVIASQANDELAGLIEDWCAILGRKGAAKLARTAENAIASSRATGDSAKSVLERSRKAARQTVAPKPRAAAAKKSARTPTLKTLKIA